MPKSSSTTYSLTAGQSSVLDRLNDVATAGYALLMDVDYLVPAWQVVTYPAEWVEKYRTSHYAVFDPVFYWSALNTGATRWSDLGQYMAFPPSKRVMDEAAKRGLVFGASAVTRNRFNNGLKCILSVSRSDRDLRNEEVDLVENVLVSMLEVSAGPQQLSPGDADILQLMAEGLTQRAIANSLNIAPVTVEKRLERVRKSLGVSTSAAALAKAAKLGLLELKYGKP